MMNGAVFGDKHSKEDYGAVMNYARITPPSVKENYVNIAGGSSSVDLTEAVGGVVFEDGKISFKFTLFNKECLNKMKSDLHGKRLKIILEEDLDFYYLGRLSVTSEAQNGNIYELCIDARVNPYKMENSVTVYSDEVKMSKDIILANSRMPVMPKITIAGRIHVIFDGIRFTLETGTYEIPEITFREGYNRIKVSGNGSIKFEYRKGMII